MERTKYVVIRNGYRVSEKEYDTESDAFPEYEHWSKIVKKWPDGSKLSIEPLITK